MNDDLLISIGADLSSFDEAITQAKEHFKSLETAIGKGGIRTATARQFRGMSGDFASEMLKIETKVQDTANKIKLTMAKALNFSAKVDDWTPEQTQMLDRYYKGYISTVNSKETEANEIKKQLLKEKASWEESVAKESQKRMLAQEKTEIASRTQNLKKYIEEKTSWEETVAKESQKRMLAQEESDRKAFSDQIKRQFELKSIAIKSKKETYDRIIKIKHLSDRDEIASEYRKLRTMSHAQLREYEKQETKKTEIYRREAAKKNADSAVGRSFLDSVKVVAKYGAISQALYGMQGAMTSIIAESARFDNSIKKTMAVLNLKEYSEGLDLAKTIVDVGKSYGQSFEEIEKGMLTIGRAGVTNIDDLKSATKGLAALSIITGDSISDGAAATASLLSVYPELTNATNTYKDSQGNLISGTEDLLNKMGAVANATRLGLADFSTISNYALTTAKSVGLSSDAYLALAGSLSKVGLNASTIGTSIRRLNKFTDDSASSVQKFFNVIGKSQKDFAKELADNLKTKNIDESEIALGKFAQRLSEMSDSDFGNAISELNIQMKATAVSFREIGKINAFANMMRDVKSAASILKQGEEAAKGLTTRWNIAINTLKSSMNLAMASIVHQIELVLNKAEKDGVNSFEVFGQAIQAFGAYAIKIIADLGLSLSGIINLISISVGGFAKLFGIANQAGAALKTYSKEELAEQKEIVALQRKDYQAVYDPLALDRLKREENVLKEMQKANTSAELLRARGTEQRNFGDDLINNAVKAQEAINNLHAGVYKGVDDFNKAMDDVREKAKAAKKDAQKYDTSGYVKNGLLPELTPEQQAIREKAILQQKLFNNELSSEQVIREELAIDISELATKYSLLQAAADADVFSNNKALEADRAKKALYDKLIEQKKVLQGQSEKNAKSAEADSKRADAAAKRAIKDQETKNNFIDEGLKARLKEMRLEAEAKMLKIDLKYEQGGSGLSLESDTIRMYRERRDITKKLLKDAEALVKKENLNEKQRKKALAEYANLRKKADEEALDDAKMITAEIGRWSSVFDSLFSGDFEGMINGIFEDAFKGLSKNIATSITGTAGSELLGSIAGGLTGSLIGLGVSAIGSLIGGATGEMTAEEEAKFAGVSASELNDESIKNLASAFENAQYPMLEVTNKMYKHIRNMDNNFYEIARAIAGVSATSGIDITGASFNGGLYEGSFYSSKTKDLLGAGLMFANQTLEQLANFNEIIVQGYESIKTTKEYAWKTRITYATKLFDLPTETVRLFAASFAEGYQQILTAGVSLGISQVDLEKALNEATITLGEDGKINLEGLDQAGVADALSAIFSTAFNQVVSQISQFDVLIDRYAKGVEQSYETLIRIALEFDQASHYFALIGKEFKDGGEFEYLKTWTEEYTVTIHSLFKDTTQTITESFSEMATSIYTSQMQMLDIVESAGGMQSFSDAMGVLMSNFYTDAEQLEFMTKSLDIAFETLGIRTMPTTNDEFRKLLETMDTSTESGAYLYGQVLLLAESFNQMTTASEQLREASTSAISGIADAWLGELSYLTLKQKADFASGYLSISRESNDMLSSVDAARANAEIALKTTSSKEEYIPIFNRYIEELSKEVDDATNRDLLEELRALKNEVIELKEATYNAAIHA